MAKTSTITNISILWRNEKAGKNKAIVNVELFNCIVLKYNVIGGKNGIFAVPSTHKGNNDKYYSDFFINDEKLYKEIAEKVIDVFEGNPFKEN
mgnify:FL=1